MSPPPELYHGTSARALELAAEDHPFHRPAPGIWLTPRVPPGFLDSWPP